MLLAADFLASVEYGPKNCCKDRREFLHRFLLVPGRAYGGTSGKFNGQSNSLEDAAGSLKSLEASRRASQPIPWQWPTVLTGAAGSDFSQFTGHFQLVSWWNVVSPQTVSIRTDAINWFPSNWVKFSSFLDWKWSNLTSVMTHFTGAVQNVLHFIWTWPNLDEMLSVSAWFNSISILFCVDLTRPRQLNSFQ